MSKWQLVDSAPKEGSILGYFRLPGNAQGVHVMHWDDDRFARKPRPHWSVYGWMWGQRVLHSCQPTHWMPLPDPPEPA